jgi:hypothetical protein
MLGSAVNDSHPFNIRWFRVAAAPVELAGVQPGADLFRVKPFRDWLGLEDPWFRTSVRQDHNQAPCVDMFFQPLSPLWRDGDDGDMIWRFVDSERIPSRLEIADVGNVSQIGKDVDSISDILDHLALNPAPPLEKVLYPGGVQLAAKHTGCVGVQLSEAPSHIGDRPAFPREAQPFVDDPLNIVPTYCGAFVAQRAGADGSWLDIQRRPTLSLGGCAAASVARYLTSPLAQHGNPWWCGASFGVSASASVFGGLWFFPLAIARLTCLPSVKYSQTDAGRAGRLFWYYGLFWENLSA